MDMSMQKGSGGNNSAKAEDDKQGGNKAAPRGGANNGIYKHPLVDNAGPASRAKAAMAEDGHRNVTYHDCGAMW